MEKVHEKWKAVNTGLNKGFSVNVVVFKYIGK